MIFEILTLHPGFFAGPLDVSILARARAAGLLDVHVRDIRDHAEGRHRVCDDTPYGGGPGMVMKPEPIAAAMDAAAAARPGVAFTRVYLTPDGEPWTQPLAEEFAALPAVMLLCGHYEGVDERIRATRIDREISLGDYVMTGGETAALAILDSVARLLPGVLGNQASAEHESHSGHLRLLDHPHYTRPETWEGRPVPEVLRNGNHAHIDRWRLEQSLRRTRARRADMLEPARAKLDKAGVKLLKAIEAEPGETAQ